MPTSLRDRVQAASGVSQAQTRYTPPTELRAVGYAIVIVLWLTLWVPSLTNVILTGREYIPFGESSRGLQPLASSISSGLVYALFGLLFIALVIALLTHARARVGIALVLMIPWVAIHGVDFAQYGSLSIPAILYPLTILALSLCAPPPMSMYKLLAGLTVLMAILSIALGLLPGGPGLMPQAAFEGGEKAIIGGTILAGPYGHSNQLGINLALGLPVVAWAVRGRWRLLALGVVVTALAWSASRTSLGVAVAVIAITLTARVANRRFVRPFVFVAIAIGTCLAIFLPLAIKDPLAFSSRGLIWQESIREFSNSLWTGAQSNAYSTASDLSIRIGAIINSGHNVFVTVITLGGIVGLVGLAVAFAFLFSRARRAFGSDPVPALFLLVLILMSIIEEPLRAFILAPTSYIVWPMLIQIGLARPSPGSEDPRRSHDLTSR